MADEQEIDNHDPQFEPLVNLPPVQTKTLEEDEEDLIKLRAKLFRYDTSAEPPEWKERGTGDVKVLRHKENGTCRVLMRRDKTHKICANHYVLPHMELKPNCGSERAWVWSTFADFADEEAKTELLAIRFSNAENAHKFKAKFDEAKIIMEEILRQKPVEKKESKTEKAETESSEKSTTTSTKTTTDGSCEVTKQLSSLSVNEKSDGKTGEKDDKSDDVAESEEAEKAEAK